MRNRAQIRIDDPFLAGVDVDGRQGEVTQLVGLAQDEDVLAVGGPRMTPARIPR